MAQWGATGDTAGRCNRVGRAAVATACASKAFRKFLRGTVGRSNFLNGRPDLVVEADIFKILSEIIQAADQAKGIPFDCQQGRSEAGGNAKPGLLAKSNDNAILVIPDGYPQSSDSTGLRILTAGNLNDNLVTGAGLLGHEVAAVKTSDQRLSHIAGRELAVVDASFHVVWIIIHRLRKKY